MRARVPAAFPASAPRAAGKALAPLDAVDEITLLMGRIEYRLALCDRVFQTWHVQDHEQEALGIEEMCNDIRVLAREASQIAKATLAQRDTKKGGAR